MIIYLKIASSAPDALPESPPPPLSSFWVFKALTTHTHLHICTHTHATRIRKSHNVLNDTPETYFIVRTK